MDEINKAFKQTGDATKKPKELSTGEAIKKPKVSKADKLKAYIMGHAKAEAVKLTQTVVNDNPQGFYFLSVCDDNAARWHENRDVSSVFGDKIKDFNVQDMSVHINGAKYQLALVGGKDDKPIEILTRDGKTFNSKILTGRQNGVRPYYHNDGTKVTPGKK